MSYNSDSDDDWSGNPEEDFERLYKWDPRKGWRRVAKSWRWFLVSATLYRIRLSLSGKKLYLITKTVLQKTTYLSGVWYVVELLAHGEHCGGGVV